MAYLDGLQVALEILENQGTAQDSGGQPVKDWVVTAEVKGRIDAIGGEERGRMAEGSRVTHQAQLPAGTVVNGAMRLRRVSDGKVYNVIAVEEIAGRGGAVHHLTCDLESIG